MSSPAASDAGDARQRRTSAAGADEPQQAAARPPASNARNRAGQWPSLPPGARIDPETGRIIVRNQEEYDRLKAEHEAMVAERNRQLDLKYGAEQVLALFMPVSVCMAVVVATIRSVSYFSEHTTQFLYTPFETASATSAGAKFGGAVSIFRPSTSFCHPAPNCAPCMLAAGVDVLGSRLDPLALNAKGRASRFSALQSSVQHCERAPNLFRGRVSSTSLPPLAPHITFSSST